MRGLALLAAIVVTAACVWLALLLNGAVASVTLAALTLLAWLGLFAFMKWADDRTARRLAEAQAAWRAKRWAVAEEQAENTGENLKRGFGKLYPLSPLLGLLIAFLSLPGCYCWQAAHKNEPRCASVQEVKHVLTGCAEPAAQKLIAQIIPQVVAALVSQNWGDLVSELIKTLEGQGVQDAFGLVTCAIESVDGNLVAARGAALPPHLIVLKAHAQAWLAANPHSGKRNGD